MKIKELLTDESKWTKGALAKSHDGEFVFPDSKDAICWCLIGASDKCSPDIAKHEECLIKIRKEINSISISVWNDASERTFQEIRSLVEKLDI